MLSDLFNEAVTPVAILMLGGSSGLALRLLWKASIDEIHKIEGVKMDPNLKKELRLKYPRIRKDL
ncbi:MAG: hypothetical protein ACOYK8_08155 [Alphaproteobacteria bacterium]